MATNRPDTLDPALVRPGRLDRKIEFALPDLAGRAHILKIHAKQMSVERDIRYDLLARLCPNSTGGPCLCMDGNWNGVDLVMRSGERDRRRGTRLLSVWPAASSDWAEGMQRRISPSTSLSQFLSRQRLRQCKGPCTHSICRRRDPQCLH